MISISPHGKPRFFSQDPNQYNSKPIGSAGPHFKQFQPSPQTNSKPSPGPKTTKFKPNSPHALLQPRSTTQNTTPSVCFDTFFFSFYFFIFYFLFIFLLFSGFKAEFSWALKNYVTWVVDDGSFFN